MSNVLNIHNYDGKIAIKLLPYTSTVKDLPIEQKKLLGNELLVAVANKINPKAIEILRQIIESIGTINNIDTTNGLIADDLICLCWHYRENSEFIKELEIQLMDMTTGLCPQGRTHRLFQILLAFA